MILTDGIHLISSSSSGELHTFAKKIGLKREWFQNHLRHPHYDLTTSRMFLKAIRSGAKRVNSRQLVKIKE